MLFLQGAVAPMEWYALKPSKKHECIPVGCVPPMAVAIHTGYASLHARIRPPPGVGLETSLGVGLEAWLGNPPECGPGDPP